MFGATAHEPLPKSRRRATMRPSLEGLEQRLLLYSTLGGQWAYGDRISYSLVTTTPQGTKSPLQDAMEARGFTDQQWKTELRRAMAVWQSVANINLAEVPDNGAPIGVPGNQQNDSRFGDIRVYGTSTNPGVLAFAHYPPPFNGGTRAGDVALSTATQWNIGASYDLQTVAIHEVGHALGLGHSQYEQAVMDPGYPTSGLKQALSTDDVAGIRSLYGARQHDWLDQWHDNKDPWNAINISGALSNRRLQLANLDITSNADEDWFYVQAPAGASGSMRITIQSTGLSSLSPRLQVYNASLVSAGAIVSANPGQVYGSTLSLSYTGVPAGTGIYIRATGWNGPSSGVNGIGAYGLQVDFTGGAPMAPIAPPNTTVLEQPDQGGGTSELLGLGRPAAGLSSILHVVGPDEAAGVPFSRIDTATLTWLDEPMTSPPSRPIAFPAVNASAMGGRVAWPRADLVFLPTHDVAIFQIVLDAEQDEGALSEVSATRRIEAMRERLLGRA